jgi:hypothetical protein
VKALSCRRSDNNRSPQEIRRGLRDSDRKASWNRSRSKRFGERRRDRLLMRSCCFIRRLSATIALAPPGPSGLATVVIAASNISRPFMVGRRDCLR